MSGQYGVVYSPEALNDLRDLYSYIASQLLAPDAAQNQVSRIRKEIRSLDLMPSRHPLVGWEPWQSMNMRKMPVDNFVIYYMVDDDTFRVTVIRILYGGRDAENILTSEPE